MSAIETVAATGASPIVREIAQITPLAMLGQQAFPMLTCEDTNGALSLLMYVAAPQSGPPPHLHREQDETFITIDEGFEFLAGDEWRAVPSHTVVHIPAGARHTFRNASDAPARTWVFTRPGNMERFFAALADVGAHAKRQGTAPDMSRVLAIYEEYGVVPVP